MKNVQVCYILISALYQCTTRDNEQHHYSHVVYCCNKQIYITQVGTKQYPFITMFCYIKKCYSMILMDNNVLNQCKAQHSWSACSLKVFILTDKWNQMTLFHFVWHVSKKKEKKVVVRVQNPWQCMFNRLYLSPGKVGTNAACNYWSNLGSVHQVPIMAGWTEAVWNTKFTWHFYTWSALGIEPQTFWSWVHRPIYWATCSELTVSAAWFSLPPFWKEMSRWTGSRFYMKFVHMSRGGIGVSESHAMLLLIFLWVEMM